MATQLTITVFGEKRLFTAINKVDAAMEKKIVKAINASAMRIRNAAIRKARSNISTLRASIHVWFFANGTIAEIGSRLKYAPFVEFGTGPKGAKTNKQPLPPWYKHGTKHKLPIRKIGDKWEVVPELAYWAKRKGKDAWGVAYAIARKGTKAYPFLYPAFQKEIPKLTANLEKATKTSGIKFL